MCLYRMYSCARKQLDRAQLPGIERSGYVTVLKSWRVFNFTEYLKTQNTWELWRNDQCCLSECEWEYSALIRIILKMQIIDQKNK